MAWSLEVEIDTYHISCLGINKLLDVIMLISYLQEVFNFDTGNVAEWVRVSALSHSDWMVLSSNLGKRWRLIYNLLWEKQSPS